MTQKAVWLTLELRLLWVVIGIYLLSFWAHFLHFATVGERSGRAGRYLLTAGVVIHTAVVLFRTWEGGRAPYQSLYECLSWFAWSSALTYLWVRRHWKGVDLPGLLISLFAGWALLFGLKGRSPDINPLFPALQSPWYTWHVIIAFLSYAVILVSCAIEISYLVMGRRTDRWGLPAGEVTLYREDGHRLMLFGLPLLTFGIISGAAWADEAWGNYWSWDPKETWSLITWAVVTIYLHIMTVPRWKHTWRSSLANVMCFLAMMFTFLGVNWLVKILKIYSLHAYG